MFYSATEGQARAKVSKYFYLTESCLPKSGSNFLLQDHINLHYHSLIVSISLCKSNYFPESRSVLSMGKKTSLHHNVVLVQNQFPQNMITKNMDMTFLYV